MTEENKVQLVLDYVSANPNVTGTNIAKEALSLSKLRPSTKDLIDGMVSDGLLIEDNSGRFTTYSVAESATAETEESDVVTIENTTQTPAIQLDGYSIEVNQEGGYDVFTPGDDAPIVMGTDDYLLVINDEPQFVVSTPADVLQAITEYTAEKGYKSYTITDLVTNNEVKNDTDIVLHEGRILSFKVQKHNRAAC